MRIGILREWTILSLALGVASCSGAPTPAPDAAATSAPDFSEGSTFPDLALVGYTDRDKDGTLSAKEHGALRINDVVAANPTLELMLVHAAFGWCKYCWAETPDQLKWTKGYGGRFLSVQVLVEDRNGDAATVTFVDEWIAAHKSSMTTALEPNATLLKRFGRSATYMLVDPKTMKILTVGAGPPTFSFVRGKITERLGPLP